MQHAETNQSDKNRRQCDRHRILVVDDEDAIVRLFRLILSSALPEVEVGVATNGVEAVKAFGEKHHGVLLMDLHMPVMDGRTAFDEISKLCEARNWEMPSVLFCTGFVPSDAVRKLIADSSKHSLLKKPVSGKTLVEAVKARLT